MKLNSNQNLINSLSEASTCDGENIDIAFDQLYSPLIIDPHIPIYL